jgi:hypothetical protein
MEYDEKTGVRLEEVKSVGGYGSKLPNNARVDMTKTVAGGYAMAFRRLKEPDEVNGTEWEDKMYKTAFRLSPEALVAVKFLTERIYNENCEELHEVVASLINLNQRN